MRLLLMTTTATVSLCFLACGIPEEKHNKVVQELEATEGDLQAAQSQIEELQLEVEELRETPEAYWSDIVKLEKENQWSHVRDKAQELLARWPDSSYAARARRSEKQASEAIAQRIYDQAQNELDQERYETAEETLTSVRDQYPTTAAAKKAVTDLRKIDDLIERARRRAVGNGDWLVRSKTSPIDDSTNVYLTLTADNTIENGFGTQPRPTLWIRCKENTTEVFVDWDVYLGMDTTRVIQRLDDNPSRTRRWNISTDHEATFYSGSDIGFARQLMKHDQLLLRLTPYGENSATATFSLIGLENAIIELRESCGW